MKPICCLLISCAPIFAAAQNFDVLVYGGTAGGVIAAVSAAREGLKVALVEPGTHLGGMVSGGLGFTDFGKKEVIGGYALEFYFRVGRHYEMNRFGNDLAWYHEPHVAEEVFREMLREQGVSVFERHRLRAKNAVTRNGLRITEIAMENGVSFSAKVFLDSSYEGDLMAQAGVTYTFGREADAQYGETLAGVRERTPLHQFLVNVSAYDSQHHLLPGVSNEKPGLPGSADRKIQAYNFRVCLCDAISNSVPFSRPAGYDAGRYELLARLIAARAKAEGHVPALATFLKIDRLPNGKSDVNNQGAVSTDFIGGSWEYPDADYNKRQHIWQAHKDYLAGLFYFLAHDPQVPPKLQAEMNQWGLCRDEFKDSGNWPHQLYIREARRMVGEYVAVQKDLQTDLTKADAIGMGSYNSDSHNVERIVDADGFVRNEGDMQVAVTPYQIPFRVMLPKRSEVSNLLVPVCFSASHVAYSSMRMEPQYMILGQAAGVAARLAIDKDSVVQNVDSAALAAALRKQGAILEYVPSPAAPVPQMIRRLNR